MLYICFSLQVTLYIDIRMIFHFPFLPPRIRRCRSFFVHGHILNMLQAFYTTSATLPHLASDRNESVEQLIPIFHSGDVM
jgi:hypothetical protein